MRIAACTVLLGILFGVEPATALPSDGAFLSWKDGSPARSSEVQAFQTFLLAQNVAGVLPTSQLLLNATSWRSCVDAPYSLPPRALWKNIVPTLSFIRAHIVPALGPVAAVSGYRSAQLNACAGGAPRSAHALYFALDLVPLSIVDRAKMIASVCRLHARFGPALHVGLGFYQGLRFHIDTHGFRRWGTDHHGASSPCVTRQVTG